MSLKKRQKKQQDNTRRTRSNNAQGTSFRRSATLTGSVASDVKSASEERGVLKSERLVKQDLRRRQRHVGSLLLAVVAVMIGIYYLISQFMFNVGTISYQDSVFVSKPPTQEYQDRIAEYLKEQPGERFSFSLNEENLLQYMQQKYAEIVDIEHAQANEFTIALRKPIAVWSSPGGQQNFVDESGEAFARNMYTEPSVRVNDQSGVTTVQGSVVASKSFLHFLGRTVALTNESGVGTVKEATLPPNTTRQIDIRLEGRGYLIKFHIDRDPAQSVEDLKRVDTYLSERNITPEYIDLRIAGKAYYK